MFSLQYFIIDENKMIGLEFMKKCRFLQKYNRQELNTKRKELRWEK